MSNYIEVHWTSGSIDEARRVSRYLVQERYVASAQIIPWVESISMLNNQLETMQESKIVMKSTEAKFEQIKKIIIDNCKYQIPEITFIRIAGGSQEYLDWIHKSTPEFQHHQ